MKAFSFDARFFIAGYSVSSKLFTFSGFCSNALLMGCWGIYPQLFTCLPICQRLSSIPYLSRMNCCTASLVYKPYANINWSGNLPFINGRTSADCIPFIFLPSWPPRFFDLMSLMPLALYRIPILSTALLDTWNITDACRFVSYFLWNQRSAIV